MSVVPVTPVDSDPSAPCPNCDAPPAAGRFCPSCGQRNDRLRLPVRALASDLLKSVFKLDRKVPATGLSLLLPGQLTLEYLRGHRARHLPPLGLFLLLAGLQYLAWSSSWQREDGFRLRSGAIEASLDLGDAQAVDGGAVSVVVDGGPGPGTDDAGVRERRWLTPQLNARLAAHPERALAALDALESPKGQLAVVLGLLVGVAMTTRQRRFFMSEHLVFVLHLQAFSALTGAAVALSVLRKDFAVFLCLAYNAIAFYRVYRLGLWGTAWRSLVATVVAVLVLVATIILTVMGYLLW